MYLLIMAIRPDALPTDAAALTEMVLALDAENEKLSVVMQTLKELIFGKRSERLLVIVADQLALELDDLETGVTPPASPFAREMIERLQAVYAVEAEIRGSTAEERLAARRIRTAPLTETLRTRLTAMVGQLFSQSKLTEAINYALNHWDGLTLFLSDGRVEVDSNTVERSMGPIAMGRRNSLFSGSEGGAESWAILASLVNTAKLHDLDPQAYLADVLERIVSGRTKSHQLHELLAWNWKAAHARIAQVAA